MNGGYDAGYLACSCFWGREPGSLVRRLLELIGDVSKKCVLDAGCGEGKNAMYLSERGAIVRALDISEIAIANAQKAWKTNGNIKWEVADVSEVSLTYQSYDIVIAYGLLHCLSDSAQIKAVISKLQMATKINGYNILCAFNDRSQDLTAHPEFRPCLVNHSFYLDLYSGWQMVEASDTDLTETHPHNNIEHTHSMTRLLARKHL